MLTEADQQGRRDATVAPAPARGARKGHDDPVGGTEVTTTTVAGIPAMGPETGRLLLPGHGDRSDPLRRIDAAHEFTADDDSAVDAWLTECLGTALRPDTDEPEVAANA